MIAAAMMMTVIITAKENPPTEQQTTIMTKSLVSLKFLFPPTSGASVEKV